MYFIGVHIDKQFPFLGGNTRLENLVQSDNCDKIKQSFHNLVTL